MRNFKINYKKLSKLRLVTYILYNLYMTFYPNVSTCLRQVVQSDKNLESPNIGYSTLNLTTRSMQAFLNVDLFLAFGSTGGKIRGKLNNKHAYLRNIITCTCDRLILGS